MPAKRTAALLALLAAGCRGVSPAPAPGPAPDARPVTPAAPGDAPARPAPPPQWPAPPAVTGPLALRVTYPRPGAVLAVRDSTFLFGSVGSGDAALRINGVSVPVAPNGAFLAWLPVPSADAPRYDLLAVRGADTARLSVPVKPPAPRVVWADTGRLSVEPGSVQPASSPRAVFAPDELLRVSVRTSAAASVRLRLADSSVVAVPATGPARTIGTPMLFRTEVPAGRLGSAARLEISRGRDTLRLPVGPLALADTALPPLVQLQPAAATAADSDRVVIGRPVPGGTYHWFLLPGTVVRPTGRSGDAVRVQLDRQQEVWVSAQDAQPVAPGTVTPRRILGNARLVPVEDGVDVVLPMADVPPYRVEAAGSRLVLTLYGTTPNVDILGARAGTSELVRQASVTADATDRTRVTLDLTRPVFGWEARWQGGAFVLRVRRPPVVAAARPLEGLLIAVDPGHPPAGSTGPTGLYEPVAVRWVAERLAPMLEARGARVLLTRTSDAPLDLGARPAMARRAGAHAFVSIHLNALPDGANPFSPRLGTGTYWFHPPSAPLASAVQAALVARLGLADEGTFFDNLAVLRTPWMPSVLTEGAYIMLPSHEAWLRMPAFQEAYAAGIADGLERYFRQWAGDDR